MGRRRATQSLRRVNIDVLVNPHLGPRNRYAFWFTHRADVDRCVAAPTTLDQVWALRAGWDARFGERLAGHRSEQGVPVGVGRARPTEHAAGRARGHGASSARGVPALEFVPLGGNVGLAYVPPASP